MGLHVVLIEPEIPQNTGNISRTCAATNTALHLVHPLGFAITEKHLRRAGLDYWKYLTLTEYPNTPAFFDAHGEKELYYVTTKSDQTYADITYPKECFFLFGKETLGLDEELLAHHRSRCIRIPMVSEARSLNLSNAVAVLIYEYYRQQGFDSLMQSGHLHHRQWESEA